jgi:hypothetical protein
VSDRTVLLGQALDAIDPRLDEHERTEAAAQALADDPVLAGAVFASIATTVLAQVAEQSAPAEVDEVMNALAVVITDATPYLPDSGAVAW